MPVWPWRRRPRQKSIITTEAGSSIALTEAIPFGEREFLRMYDAFRSWVYIAIMKNAQTIAGLDWDIWDNTKEQVLADDHALRKLLTSPNPDDDFSSLMEITVLQMQLFGNAFWYLVLDRAGIPREIYPLSTPYLRVDVSNNRINKWIYERAGQKIEIAPEEIVHFKLPHPLISVWGYSPMVAGSHAIKVNEQLLRQGYLFLKRGGTPPFAVIPEEPNRPISDADIKRLITQYERSHGRWIGTGRPWFLTLKARLEKLGFTMKDLESEAIRQAMREEITALFGVPLGTLGVVKDVNRATAEALIFTYAEHTVKPLARRIERKINSKVVSRFGDYTFEFENIVPEDKEFRLRELETHIKLGYSTINEERAEDGKEPIPWGKYAYMPMNMVPVGTQPSEQKAIYIPKKKSVKDEARRTAIWKSYVALITPLELQWAEKIRRYFREQRDEVLSNLRRYSKRMGRYLKQESDIDYVLFAEFEWVRRFRELGKGVLVGAVESGFLHMQGKLNVDISWDVYNPRVIQYVEQHTSRVAELINMTTRERLIETLTEGYRNGESIDQLADRIMEVYDDATRRRAVTIARTDIVGASNWGQLEAMNEAGFEWKEWLTARDEKVREAHWAADGQIVRINEPFEVGGEALMWPGDLNGSPGNIINCRCTVNPAAPEWD